MGKFFEKPFDSCIDYRSDHCAKIKEKVEKIDAVERAIDFFEHRDAVYGGQRNGFIINVKVAGACGKKKNEQAYDKEDSDKRFF